MFRQTSKELQLGGALPSQSSLVHAKANGHATSSREESTVVKTTLSDGGGRDLTRDNHAIDVSNKSATDTKQVHDVINKNIPKNDQTDKPSLTSLILTQSGGLSTLKHQFKLRSVIEHYGDVNSGHFVTYRRAPASENDRFSEQWLYTSDTVVRKVSKQEASCAEAYMLFYERLI